MQKPNRLKLAPVPQQKSYADVYNVQISAATINRLEALKALSQAIMKEVTSTHLEKIPQTVTHIDLANEVSIFEADLIRCALMRTGGRQRAAARLLGVKTTTLHAKIRRFGIEIAGTVANK